MCTEWGLLLSLGPLPPSFPTQDGPLLRRRWMADQIFYLGEVGRSINQTTGIDWTGATGKQVKIQKPSGVVVTRTNSDVIVDDAETGQIHILTEAGDLDETGEYLFQAKVTISDAVKFGPLMGFTVDSVISGT